MANRNDQGDHESERMGRGVKEGLNAGQSRNAHDSGSRGGSAAGAGSSGMQGASSDRGRGGYGDDSGFTGGSRASREDADRDEESHNSPRAAAPGSEGANVEDHSRIDGVGHQAPSGLDERESSGETR